MSLVHIRMIEDSKGDLIDLEYYHHYCSPDDVLGWPSPESTDSPVYCAKCGEWIDAVTREGELNYPELAS